MVTSRPEAERHLQDQVACTLALSGPGGTERRYSEAPFGVGSGESLQDRCESVWTWGQRQRFGIDGGAGLGGGRLLALTLGESGEAACICWYSGGGLGWRRPILILGMMEATGCLRRGEVAEGSRGAEGEGKEMKALWELWGTPPTDLH